MTVAPDQQLARPGERPLEQERADQATWQVRVLGRFELDDGRQCLTRLRSRAAMALVARLAMAPDRAHGREELAALLWPEADAEAGRSRLRQTLSLVRAVLEPPGSPALLRADRRMVRAVPGAFWCDAVAFERSVRERRPGDARAFWRGELLPGFYDEWVVDERERLQALLDRLPEGGGDASAPSRSPPSTRSPGSAPDEPASRGHAPSAASAQRLPHYLTRLVGADRQGARLQTQVQEHRLLTLLGAGGSGKTRLAIEVARSLVQAVPGAPASPEMAAPFELAVFVPLVGAVSSTDLLDRIALALRVKASGDATAILLEVLEGRRLLLVLDNAEQLDAAAAGAIAHLVERLPELHLLVTSRRPLELDGERRFALHALDLPQPGAALAEVTMNPAVALFVDRARAHQPDFHVHGGIAGALVELVRWLEGLPLAIELAASHVRTQGPGELLGLLVAARAERLQGSGGPGSFALLARRGPRSGSDPRHASMEAVLAASWQLLSDGPRQLLAALCLLPAGATAALAAALATAEAGPPAGIGTAQAMLDELVEQSVAMPGLGQDGRSRFAPIEAVREYVLARLDADAARCLRRRALTGLLDWARAMPPTPSLPAVRDEMPNLLAAFVHAPADGEADRALELVLLLQSSWGEMAVPAGVLAALDRLLEATGLDDSLAAGGHALAAIAHQDAGHPDDVRRHREAALARPCPDLAIRSMVLSRMARMTWRVDKDAARARALIAEALPIARAAGRPNTEGALLSLEGHLATLVDGDPVRGKALSTASLALWATSGNRHLVNNGRYNVAVQTMEAGSPAAAIGDFEALAAEGRELQDWDLVAGSYEARGTAFLHLGRYAESAQSLREALEVAWTHLELQAALHALWNIPPALARLGQGELAARTMGAAEAQWHQRFGALDRRDRRDVVRMRRFARAALGPAAAAGAWADGARTPLGDAVRRVLETVARGSP